MLPFDISSSRCCPRVRAPPPRKDRTISPAAVWSPIVASGDEDPPAPSQFFQAALDALTAHIAILDESGTIIAVNGAWRRFGEANGLRLPYHGVGMNYLDPAEAATGADATAGRFTAAGIRAVLGGERDEFVLEYPCHAPDEERWFIVRVTRMAGFSPAHVVVAHENITARKQAEMERTAFLDAVAHDLKNPLTVAKGQAQLARRRLLRGAMEAERLVADLERIASAIDGGIGLVDGLLEAAHLRAGRPLALNRDQTDLVVLARAATDAAQQSTARHVLRVEASVPALRGTWDGARLERVLGNLLSNAIKYSPSGGEIVVQLRREDDPTGAWAVLAVTDHGIGIPPSDLPHLFERFHRAGNVARIGGTGIGLAGVEQIVEQHGGTVSVESAEGLGSTFTVRLPLVSIARE